MPVKTKRKEGKIDLMRRVARGEVNLVPLSWSSSRIIEGEQGLVIQMDGAEFRIAGKAKAITDTATLYVIAPEQLQHLIEDEKWLGMGVGNKRDELIRQYGGALFNTAADGEWNVEIKPKEGYGDKYPQGKDYIPKKAARVPQGWTKSKPASYTLYTSPSGKVRVQDTHASGKVRFQVIYKSGNQWHESHETGSLVDAFRVAQQDEVTLARGVVAQRVAHRWLHADPTDKIVEVPYSFSKVKVEPPKAKRKKFPFEGYIDLQGLKIDVENKEGSTRKGEDSDGNEWETKMWYHYGEIRGTEGTDGDKLDVYVGPNADSSLVVVIHQHNPWDGKYDEDKCMLGFDSVEEAIGAYKKQYDKPGFYVDGEYTDMPMGQFWRWVNDTRKKGKKVQASRVAHLFLCNQ